MDGWRNGWREVWSVKTGEDGNKSKCDGVVEKEEKKNNRKEE